MSETAARAERVLVGPVTVSLITLHDPMRGVTASGEYLAIRFEAPNGNVAVVDTALLRARTGAPDAGSLFVNCLKVGLDELATFERMATSKIQPQRPRR